MMEKDDDDGSARIQLINILINIFIASKKTVSILFAYLEYIKKKVRIPNQTVILELSLYFLMVKICKTFLWDINSESRELRQILSDWRKKKRKDISLI